MSIIDTPRPKRHPVTKERLTLCCNDCGIEADAERATVYLRIQSPQGPVVSPHSSMRKPDGWTEGEVKPSGKPIIINGATMIDPWKDTAEEVATKTQCAQPVHRCGPCSEKAKPRTLIAIDGGRA